MMKVKKLKKKNLLLVKKLDLTSTSVEEALKLKG